MKLTWLTKQDGDSYIHWLMPRPIDWVTFAIYLGVLAVYGYFCVAGIYQPAVPFWLGAGLIVLTLVILLVIDRLEYWRYQNELSWPRALVFLSIRVVLVFLVSFVDGIGWRFNEMVFLLVPSTILLFSGGTYGLFGTVWITYLIGRARSATGLPLPFQEPTPVFTMMSGLAFLSMILIAYSARQEKRNRLQTEQLLRDLEDSHRQLRIYANQVAALATTEERNRIARDIHDSLGHYLTVINIQLEKAIVYRDKDSLEADASVHHAKHLANEALADVRQSVGALRNTSEAFSLTSSLSDLIETIKRGSQFLINLQIKGDENGFSKQSLLTLYRVVQEGLTNVQKHAQATQVSIQVELDEQEARLVIVDNGRGFNPAMIEQTQMNNHYGLRGIRERLELVQGLLKLESSPNQGTSLFVTVPKDPLTLLNS